ncbi:hypothetical protein JAAARDRAFT_36605 [Jaapia argillacea MUCL 33604]|uniref:Uncharacterized protein n=1 Tax=Jaapia argillacea MUCL 33604 TaxID=933084 RepID=A0A067PNV6_9AGAM|nr:hypothetical protein JAAARDRAFT_36605 [Jaapia argillacea MUCL 33604]
MHDHLGFALPAAQCNRIPSLTRSAPDFANPHTVVITEQQHLLLRLAYSSTPTSSL